MNEINTTENINILDLSNKNIKDQDNIFEHLSKFPELEEVRFANQNFIYKLKELNH